MTVLTVLALLGGLVLLAGGGEVLVRGATRIASALGLSGFVIGLTVVSFATSAPELAVTLQASLTGNPGLAVGNVVGSNIVNVLLILGICAVIMPLAVKSQLVRLDIPTVIALSVLALLVALDGDVDRLDGALLLAALVGYVAATVVIGRRRAGTDRDPVKHASDPPQVAAVPGVPIPPGLAASSGSADEPGEGGDDGGARSERPLVALGLVAVGVALLVGGANLLVSGATDVAAAFGVSDLVIGLSVVAVGTSLGSCLFNIGAVLGLSAIITSDGIPVADAAVRLDLPVMIATALALAPIAFTGFTVARWEGALFVAYYIAYLTYVLLDATDHDAVEPFSGVMLGFVVPITVLWLSVLVAYEVGLRRGRSQAGG